MVYLSQNKSSLQFPKTFKFRFLYHQKANVTKLAQHDIEQALREQGVLDKVKVNSFSSSILKGYYIMGKTTPVFGCQTRVNIKKLTKQQISEKVEEYKAQDGRYIYEGAFLSREELERVVAKQYAILTLQLKYKVNSDAIKVYEIDYIDSPEIVGED